MLSPSQVEYFLEKTIKFKNWRKVLDHDKLEFLRLLVPHYTHHLYFQNVSMSALPSEKRKVLDEAEIIDAGLKGIGGNCLTQNGFLYMLLKVLGFNSYLASGFVHGSRNRQDNHVVCVVEFSIDEKYLMDLGVGLPFAEPVPLNKLPYTQMAAGFRYRYIKGDKGIYYRMQLDGALFGGEFDDLTAEYVRYELTLEPKPLDLFQRILAFIFNNVERSHFLQCPLLFRYFEEDGTGSLIDSPNTGDDRKWIMIRGLSVLIGTNTSRDMKHYTSYDEVKHVILKYFPKLRKDEIERAVQNYKYGYTL